MEELDNMEKKQSTAEERNIDGHRPGGRQPLSMVTEPGQPNVVRIHIFITIIYLFFWSCYFGLLPFFFFKFNFIDCILTLDMTVVIIITAGMILCLLQSDSI